MSIKSINVDGCFLCIFVARASQGVSLNLPVHQVHINNTARQQLDNMISSIIPVADILTMSHSRTVCPYLRGMVITSAP